MVDQLVFIQKRNEEHTIITIATDDMAVTTKRAIDVKNFKQNIKSIGYYQ